MKIIAIADTHIKYGSIRENLPLALLNLLEGADMIIHAGDFVTLKAFDELSNTAQFHGVHGNMDEPALKQLLPEKKLIEVEGIRIGIVHEASFSILDFTGAGYLAKEMGVNILVFGHIHKPVIERSDVLLVCPGSPTSPRLSEPSAVELVIENGNVSGKILTFKGTTCSSIESAISFGKK
jgi:putative phosphoesterase